MFTPLLGHGLAFHSLLHSPRRLYNAYGQSSASGCGWPTNKGGAASGLHWASAFPSNTLKKFSTATRRPSRDHVQLVSSFTLAH